MSEEKQVLRKKNMHFRKSFVMLVSAAALLVGVVGGTVAFLVTNTDSVINDFTYGHVRCEVEETFNGNMKSDVCITNTGDTEAFIRARIIVTWKDVNGNVYGKLPVEGTDYALITGHGWTKGGNYYYYTSTTLNDLDTKTSALIEKCEKLTSADVPEGYDLSVEIIADAVQSDPDNAVTEAWGNGVPTPLAPVAPAVD